MSLVTSVLAQSLIMSKEKIILTDCDGVTSNWNKGFNLFMDERGMPQLPNTDNEYSLAARHSISVQKAGALIREFNEGPCIADLEPFADAVEYIAKLASNGFRFIVVTSISAAASAKY